MHIFPTVTKIGYTGCIILILISCGGNHSKKHESQSDSTTQEATKTSNKGTSPDLYKIFKSPGLQEWETQIKKDYPHFSVNHFKEKDKHQLSVDSSEEFPKEKWSVFKPYFIPSPNGKYAVDMYSYGNLPPDSGSIPEGGTPDSEINLVNLSNKTKTQLLFAGPGTTFQHAEWLNDSIVILVGESDANQQNEMTPTCWKINLHSKTITEFAYPSKTSP